MEKVDSRTGWWGGKGRGRRHLGKKLSEIRGDGGLPTFSYGIWLRTRLKAYSGREASFGGGGEKSL